MSSEKVDSLNLRDNEDTTDSHGNLILKYKITLEVEEKNSDTEKLRTLLTELKDINSPDANDNHNTLLHFAVNAGNDVAVELLLNNGASVNAINSNGQTPLQVAEFLSLTKSGVKKKIQTLLTQSQPVKEYKKIKERISDNEQTEVQSIQTDEKIFESTFKYNPGRSKYLLSKDDVEKSNSEEIITKINELLGHEMSFASNTKKQQILLEMVNEACDEDGNTALIICAKNKDSEKLKLFLNFEADVNKTNNNKMRAADYSWIERDYISLLELYNKGSYFPKECSVNQVESDHKYEKDLKKLISHWETLQKEIESKSLASTSAMSFKDKRNLQGEIFNETITKLHRQLHDTSKEKRYSTLKEAIHVGQKEQMKLALSEPSFENSMDMTCYGPELNLLNNKNAWDEDGNTPLILSAKDNDHEILKFLLDVGVEVDEENFMGLKAIDYSWKNEDYFSVLELLKKDSYFPRDGAKPEDVSKEKADAKTLMEFIIRRNELHEAIKEGNLEKVESYTEKQQSEVQLSPNNKSALLCAAESEQLGVHAFLLSKGACVTKEETDRYRRCMKEEYIKKLKVILDKYIFEPEDSPAKKLCCKSICYGKTRNCYGNSNENILSFFRELENSKYLLPILKVLQFHLNLLIIFSFNCKCTTNKDLDDPDGTRGSTDFINGLIHVAAKDSNNNREQRSEVLGTLAHEMAHQAIHLTFNNQCNPYLKEDCNSAAKLEEITMEICKSVFKNILKKETKRWKELFKSENDCVIKKTKISASRILKEIKCEENENFKDMILNINENFINDLLKEEEIDPIIRLVFTVYKKEFWHRELIVRIPHLIAKYGETTGEEKLTKQFPKLFNYYKENVITKMEGFLRIGSNIMSRKEAMEIFIMNENLGIMKAIDRGNIWLKNLTDFKPHYHSYGVFEMVKTSSVKLCTLYFYQTLRDKFKDHFHMQCLFISMSSFEHNIDKILYLAQSEACKAIVLISDSSSCDIKNLANRFLEPKAEIYVILSDKYPENFETTIFKWSLFTEESRKALMSKRIKFFGTTVTLAQLLNSNKQQFEIIQKEYEFLDPKALALLVEENILTIADENESSHLPEYDNEYYIDRYFCKQAIQKDILSEETKEYILYITNVSTEDLYSMNIPKDDIHELNNDNIKLGKRILIKNSRAIESDESFFSKIMQKCNSQRKIVHWLNMENGYLIWKNSNGKIGSLEKFINPDKKVKYEGEIIAEESKKIVILVDMPGMGKSTTLSKLQNDLKAKEYWSLRFHVADLVKKFSDSNIHQMNAENKISPVDAINVIADIKFNNHLIKSIFKMCCSIRGRVVLIFDGFDEVQQKFKNPIINLIKLLISSQVMQIWISARTNEKVFLERELQVMAFSLNVWDRKDQIEFANKLWNKKLNSLNEDKYVKKCCKLKEAISLWRKSFNQNFDETTMTGGFPQDINKPILENRNQIDFSEFLEHIISQLNEELRMFVSIPLHTLILANVIFEENFRIENGLNIYELYKHFIKQTFQRYYEKCQLDFKNCEFLQHLLNEKLIKTSQCIVRDNLRLDINLINPEINENLNLDKIIDCFDKIGICTASGQFFHQNIAEYLFVEWIFVNSGIPAIQKLCVDKILIEEKFSVVRQFISSKIEFMMYKKMTYSYFLFGLDTQKLFMPKKLLSILERMIAEGLDSFLKFFFGIFEQAVCEAINTVNKKKQNILHHICSHGKRNLLCDIFKFRMHFEHNNAVDGKGDKMKGKEKYDFYNGEDKWNTTPFQYAIKTGDKELVACFIKNIEGILSPNWVNENLILLANNSSDSALHTAVRNAPQIHGERNFAVLNFLWQKITDYEMAGMESLKSILTKQHQRSKNAITHIAAYNGCSWLINEIFKFLVDRNNFSSEYLNLKNDSGYTVLHVAVLRDDCMFLDEMVSVLGGNVKKIEWTNFLTMTDNWKDNALHKSAYRSHTKTMELLLNFSKNVLDKKSLTEFLYQQNNKGYTALHKSVFYGGFPFFKKYWYQLKLLLGDKSFLDLVKVRNNYEDTILHTAASVGNLDIVKLLCKFFNDRNEINFILGTDFDKDTVLHKASIKGQIDVLLYVADFVEVKMKKDFNDFFCKVNKHGNTVLHLALRSPSSIHHKVLEYADQKLTKEQYEKFRFCKNLSGETYYSILAQVKHST